MEEKADRLFRTSVSGGYKKEDVRVYVTEMEKRVEQIEHYISHGGEVVHEKGKRAWVDYDVEELEREDRQRRQEAEGTSTERKKPEKQGAESPGEGKSSEKQGKKVKKGKKPKHTILFKILAACFALLAACYAVLFCIGRFSLETTFYTIESDKTEERIRVAGLADLHNWTFGRDNERLVGMVADAQPDIILIAGDIVTAGVDDISVAVSLCKKLVEIAPVYYSFGNHENIMVYGFDLQADFLDAQAEGVEHGYGKLDYSQLTTIDSSLPDALREAGVTILNNDASNLEVNGISVDVIGFDTCTGRYWQYSSRMVEESLLTDPDHVKLLITHRPNVAQLSMHEYQGKMETEQQGQFVFDLLLCGHKHGGIVRVPGKGGMFAGLGDGKLTLFEGYDSGMVSDELGNVVISRGLGNHNLLPRINNKPELVVVDIE